MKHILSIAFACIILTLSVSSCKRKLHNGTDAIQPIILRFTMDKEGNVVEEEARVQILALGKHIHETADKRMMYIYTEQTGSEASNEQLAKDMARAVKRITKTQGERSYYNLGVDIRGYENPIDSLHPSSIENRRIEIRPL